MAVCGLKLKTITEQKITCTLGVATENFDVKKQENCHKARTVKHTNGYRKLKWWWTAYNMKKNRKALKRTMHVERTNTNLKVTLPSA